MRLFAFALIAASTLFVNSYHHVVVVDGQVIAFRYSQISRTLARPTAVDPSKPLFTVGIDGGFTGATMLASVYGDGHVLTVRQGGNMSHTTTQTRVPLSRGAVQAVLSLAVRTHVFAIPRSVQDAVFGADVPLLSFNIATTRGTRSVHALGSERTHAPGSRVFFPVWNLLYALAGYPPQIH